MRVAERQEVTWSRDGHASDSVPADAVFDCVCGSGACQRFIDVVKLVKGAWWMPRRPEAMKDVVACDKLRGVGKQALIRRFLNGETRHHPISGVTGV